MSLLRSSCGELSSLTWFAFFSLVTDLQSWTKHLEQSREIKQNWTGTGNLDNCPCLIFDHYYKHLISGR